MVFEGSSWETHGNPECASPSIRTLKHLKQKGKELKGEIGMFAFSVRYQCSCLWLMDNELWVSKERKDLKDAFTQYLWLTSTEHSARQWEFLFFSSLHKICKTDHIVDHNTQLTKFQRKNSYKTCPQTIIDGRISLCLKKMNMFEKYNQNFFVYFLIIQLTIKMCFLTLLKKEIYI